jgi:hypothetical protein
MNLFRPRCRLAVLPAAAWLALAAPAASGVELTARTGLQAVPTVLPAPLSAVNSAWAAPASLRPPGLIVPALAPQAMVPAPPVLAVPTVALSPVVSPAAGPLPAAPAAVERFAAILSGLARSPQTSTTPDAAKLKALFDGDKTTSAEASPLRESRPDYRPHESVPLAVLPGGRAIPPDSYKGGYHGTDIDPESVERNGGLPARGPVEDWRLREHAEAASRPVSAFRGSTPFPTSPNGDTGASYWADKGGWVYEVSGVPTWDVNSELEGRVKRGDGNFRGNLMSEAESAIPAQTPIECLRRWGQVSESSSGRLYIRPGDWVANPRYDPAVCRRFWARPA